MFPSELIIARPILFDLKSSQLIGVPGSFIKLSATSLIVFSILFSSTLLEIFSCETSDTNEVTPKASKIMIPTTTISSVKFPLLSILNQSIFFSVR